MIIAVEGMDGSGKTTLAKYLAEKYGFVFIDKPIKYIFGVENNVIIPELEKLLNSIYEYDDEIIKTWFFGLGNIMAVRNFEGSDIIIDRHFVSNYFWNSDDSCNSIYETLIEYIGKPDLTIILYADAKTRIERIKNRNIDDPDLNDPNKYDDGFAKMIKFVSDYEMPYEVIDTSGLKITDVQASAEKIVDKLLSESQNMNKTKILKRTKL